MGQVLHGSGRGSRDRFDRGDVLALAAGIRGPEERSGRKLKDLEAENARLRRAFSDLTLDKMILKEAARGTAGPR
jgi:hypothetical protein